MENKTLSLSLNVQQINVILTVLRKQPYEQVAAVVGAIMTQANAQMEPPAETEPK